MDVEGLPVELGPRRDVEELGRRVRDGLGPELADEADQPGHRAGQFGELAGLAAVPPEPEVTVGAVELREVGEHATVGDGGPRRIGLLERPLDPAVEDGLVPSRELMGEKPPNAPAGASATPPAVHRGPAHRGRTTERSRGGGRASSTASRAWRTASRRIWRAYPHCSGKSCSTQDAELVRGAVQLVVGDVRLHAQHVEAGLGGELDVPAHLLGVGVGEPGPRGQHVGALQEQALAVDRAHPVVPCDLAQPRAARPAIAGHPVDEELDVDVGERLGAERGATTAGADRRRGPVRSR